MTRASGRGSASALLEPKAPREGRGPASARFVSATGWACRGHGGTETRRESSTDGGTQNRQHGGREGRADGGALLAIGRAAATCNALSPLALTLFKHSAGV